MNSLDKHIEAPPYSREAIRQILRSWDSVKSLGEHPLADLGIVRERRLASGYSDTPAGRGLALRETLIAAIENLRPDEGVPDPTDKRWRPFIIINEQYVSKRTPACILVDLHISRRTYYNDQELGMEMLSDVLGEWEAQSAQPLETTSNLLSAQETAHYQVPFLAPPRAPHDLIGRDDLLQTIKGCLFNADENPVVALQGLPGVGKTTLAIALAHDSEILEYFSDGILWGGLGRHPDISALLGSWASALRVPADVLERCTSNTESAQAIHAAIGLRRILLVIDDAWSIDDALAFCLGGPNCGYLLTTRLASVALDFAGDGLVKIRELKLDQGLKLLKEFAPQVVDTEPNEAAALVESVGGLPLALILMGRYLRRHSHGVPVRRLRNALKQLQETQTRLQLSQPQSPIDHRSELSQDVPLSLQSIIGLSDTALDAVSQQALRDLALFPSKPNTFSETAALAVIARPPEILDNLHDHGLLEYLSSERYTLHQTITDYARADDASAAAKKRFVGYFAKLSESDNAAIELELNNIWRALDFAYQDDCWPDFFEGLHALQPFLLRQGLYITAEHHLQRAIGLARSHDDAQALAWLLCDLGTVALRLSRFVEAEAYLQESLSLADGLSLLELEAKSLHVLGSVAFHRNEYAEARGFFERALQIFNNSHDDHGKNLTLVSMGHALLHQGEYDAANKFYEQAVDLCREMDDLDGLGKALNGLGLNVWNQGNYDAALNYFQQCYQVNCQIGNWRMEAVALHNLGLVYDDLRNYLEARNCLQKALDIFRATGDRRNKGRTLGNLGLFSHHLGDNEAAQEYCQQAIHIAGDIGDRAGQAYALTYLGHALRELGQSPEAISTYQQGLGLWRELGHDDQAMEALAGLGRVYLSQSDIHEALTCIEEILEFEQNYQKVSTLDEPFRVYLTCYQVLRAANLDKRAEEILKYAYTHLQTHANQINDPQMRLAFLENVSAHQELITAYESIR